MQEIRNLWGKLNTDEDRLYEFGTIRKNIKSDQFGRVEYWYKEISLKIYEKDESDRGVHVANLNLKYYLKPKNMIYVSNLNVMPGFQELSEEKKSGVGGSIIRRLVEISERKQVPIFLKNGIDPERQSNPLVENIYKDKGFKTSPYLNDFMSYSPVTLSKEEMDEYVFFLS